jgi:hypothetical protein
MPDKIPMGMLGQSQNLINPIRIEKIEPLGKPMGFYRAIALDAAGICAAFFSGYAYFEFLEGSWPLIAPIGALLLFAAVLALEMLLEKKIWRRICILAAEVVALLIPFYSFNVRILAVCAAIAFLFLLIGYAQGRSELDHGTTIRFFKLTHSVTAKTVTAALLMAVILYLPAASAGAIFVGEPGFTVFFNWTAGLVGNFYPTISLTGSFDDFAQSVARTGLVGNATFQEMSPSDQNTAVSAAGDQIEANLSKSLGITASPASLMSDIAYNAIKNILQGWRDRFSIWFTAGWGLALFLILRSIGVVAVWIGQFFAMVIYELCLSSGMIRIVEEPQTKEMIEF